jgi:hypothetical protein
MTWMISIASSEIFVMMMSQSEQSEVESADLHDCEGVAWFFWRLPYNDNAKTPGSHCIRIFQSHLPQVCLTRGSRLVSILTTQS